LQKEWKREGLSPGVSGGTATAHMKWDTIPARHWIKGGRGGGEAAETMKEKTRARDKLVNCRVQ